MVRPMTATDADGLRDTQVDDPLDSDDEKGEAIRYGIASYGADLPVDAVVERLDRGDIFVPEFQRKFVWSQRQASRFVESLLLGLPVPGVFLFRVPGARTLMVVDGQQRLLTLQRFRHGLFNGREFKLVGITDEYLNRTYATLLEHDRRQLDDSIIRSTVFQQIKPSDDRSSVYAIFERLNTSGSPLQPQEIRACVYDGKLSRLLVELAGYPKWRELYRSSNPRKKDEEIILRFLALCTSPEEYARPMKQFLNDFMEQNLDPDDETCDEFRNRFRVVADTVADHLGYKALRPERSLNVSVADAVMVGLARRLENGPIRDAEALRAAHGRVLMHLKEEDLYRTGTTHKDRVERRIAIARKEYGTVE